MRVPLQITPTMSAHHKAGPLVIFWLAQILGAILAALAANSPGSRTNWTGVACFGIWFGITFAQVSLLATWTACGDGSFVARSLVSVLVGTVLWFFAFNLFRSNSNPGGFLPGIAMLTQWFVIQLPLWVVRLKWGWRLIRSRSADHENTPIEAKVQFGVKHLLGWTTLVAIILGLGKFFSSLPTFSRIEVFEFGLFLLCNSLITWPSLLVVFTTRKAWVSFLVALASMVIVTVAEPYLFTMINAANRPFDYIFWWVNGVQLLWIAGSTMALRQIGYRLISGCQCAIPTVE